MDKYKTICILVDLAKAFDTVSHYGLIKAPEQIGFSFEINAELSSGKESAIINIKNWFDAKTLTINFSKTKYIPVSINRINLTRPVKVMNNFKIEPVVQIKYLGVIVDAHFKNYYLPYKVSIPDS